MVYVDDFLLAHDDRYDRERVLSLFTWGSKTELKTEESICLKGKQIHLKFDRQKNVYFLSLLQTAFIESMRGPQTKIPKSKFDQELATEDLLEMRSVAGSLQWVSGQLRPDVAIVSLSSRAQKTKYSKPPVDERGTRVQVNFLDGCFRIAERWAEPSEHFEFAGSVMIHIIVHAEGIRIERFDLERGALRLHSSRRCIPPRLEWLVRGDQKRVDDGHRRKRHTTYELRSVIVPPYSIRMSARDHRAMANALLELLTMDAESAEPPSEIRSRDPLALQLVENRLTLIAEVALEGAEVQVMGEEGGHEWNRLGTWEPVLPRCGLRFSYHMQRKPDGGPRDVFIRGDVSSIKPVQLVISAPFVHLASRVFNDSSENMHYGYLFAGVNISGIACHVSVEEGRAYFFACLILQTLSPAGLSTGGRRVNMLKEHPMRVMSTLEEADVTWDTKKEGFLMCRLVMPRPPQLVLLITSTVCVLNRTPADLEIRFLAPSAASREALQPVTAGSTRLSIDARLLSEGVAAPTATEMAEPLAEAEKPASPEGTLLLGAGQLLSAPPKAQLRMGQAVLQLRPALTDGGVTYTWSEQFFAVPVANPNSSDVTVCASPPADMQEVLPKNWLYLRTSCGTNPQQGWSHVEVQAPFTVVNALPCDILCQFNPRERERLPVECGSNVDLAVDNGFGGEVVVPTNGQAEVMPIRLDEEGCFRWVCNGKGGRTRPRWQNLNSLIVVVNAKPRSEFVDRCAWHGNSPIELRRGEVEWHCVEASMGTRSDAPQLRIAPQSLLPCFECVAEDCVFRVGQQFIGRELPSSHLQDLSVSFAVRDTQGHASSWSLPLPAVSGRGSSETVQLDFRGMYINLNAMRSGRELIVYTRWWFVNSTGRPMWSSFTAHFVHQRTKAGERRRLSPLTATGLSDLRLQQPGGPGPLHPVASFSSKVSILPEIQNDAGDGVAYLSLRSHAPLEVIVPDVGGATSVDLTPLHPCCLRTETVALVEAIRGVPSCLVSLVPAMMRFGTKKKAWTWAALKALSAYFVVMTCLPSVVQVFFKQCQCPSDTAVLVPPNSSRPFWWLATQDQQVQVAARMVGDNRTKLSWCHAFELKESKIGARSASAGRSGARSPRPGRAGAYPVILKCGTSATSAGLYAHRELLCVCIDYDAASLAVCGSGGLAAYQGPTVAYA
eukprot:g802.t1